MAVTPPPPPQPGGALESISLSPSTVQTGTTRTSATLTFTAPTPTGGATVSLASSNTSIATVPATVTVPAHSSTGAFEVTINPVGRRHCHHLRDLQRGHPFGAAHGHGTVAVPDHHGARRSRTPGSERTTPGSSRPAAVRARPLPVVIRERQGSGRYCASPGDDLRLTRTTGVTGVPTRVQTTTFTVRARDGAGNTATKTFTLTVDPANPLVINNGTDQLRDGKVGVPYETGLFPRWRRAAVAVVARGVAPSRRAFRAGIPGSGEGHAHDGGDLHLYGACQ